MGETHQDRGYRYLFLAGEGGKTYIFWENLHFLHVFLHGHLLVIEKRHDDASWLLKPRWTTSRFWIRHPMPLCRGQAKGLENGVLEGSENTKFVGKIRWFRILFVARIRYYWEFRWIFSALCIGHKWIWRWHFLFASSFGSPVRFQPDPSDTSNCPLLTGYVWCMRSLPRKIWKKKKYLSQWRLQSWWSSSAKWQVVSLGRRVVRTLVQTTRIPRWGDSEMDGVCWSGGDFFWEISFNSSEKKKKKTCCGCVHEDQLRK